MIVACTTLYSFNRRRLDYTDTSNGIKDDRQNEILEITIVIRTVRSRMKNTKCTVLAKGSY